MTTNVASAPSVTVAPETGFQHNGTADRVMRGLLGVRRPNPRSGQSAHKAFRTSVVFSAARCIVSYVLIPVLVPILSLSGWVTAPIGLALCAVAVVNGVVSMRRFWRAEHPKRWMYAAFMGIVFVILAIALVSDLNRLGVFG